MKCPHCSYEHGFNMDAENMKIEGSDGDFYSLSNQVTMERPAPAWEYSDKPETVGLLGCPSCGKVFMNI